MCMLFVKWYTRNISGMAEGIQLKFSGHVENWSESNKSPLTLLNTLPLNIDQNFEIAIFF